MCSLDCAFGARVQRGSLQVIWERGGSYNIGVRGREDEGDGGLLVDDGVDKGFFDWWRFFRDCPGESDEFDFSVFVTLPVLNGQRQVQMIRSN